MTQGSDDYAKPLWDENKAQEIRGALVLVGLTYYDQSGNVEQQVQCYGLVTEASEDKGISIECHGKIWGGETITLPPDLDSFQRAKPGSYRLRSTGETITDPDYTTSCSINRAKD